MKVVRSARLGLQEGSSDKVYDVDLIENDALPGEQRFVVNFRYGRRGRALREGTKTATPVVRKAAERIFDSVVVSKINEGYRRLDGASAAPVALAPDSQGADGRARVLLERLDQCRRSPQQPPGLDRLLWRVGEVRLTAATPALLDIARRVGAADASYSLVFALARAAGADAVPALQDIAARSTSTMVRDLARFALRSRLVGAAQQATDIDQELPAAIAQAVRARDAHQLAGAIIALAEQDRTKVGAVLATLAGLAQHDTDIAPVLAAAVMTMPARPPYLIGLRKLYKYAEMADDAALFAAAAHRFETAQPMYRRRPGGDGRVWVPALGARVQVGWQRGAPDPRVGLSQATLYYFKRRIWRALRKRGELGDPRFADLAAAYLLSLRPDDMTPPARWTAWVRLANGTWGRQPRAIGPLGRNWTASQLLYRHAPQMTARGGSMTFMEIGEHPAADEARRDDAFPELWAARPDLALKLAAHNGCEPVALHGLRVMQADAAFVQGLAGEALGRLLTSPFAAILRFAFNEARNRLARGSVDDALLVALIGAGLREARQLAVERIDRDATLPWSSLALAQAVLTAHHEDVAEPILRWALDRRLAAGLGEPLAQGITAWLLAQPAGLDAAGDSLIRAVRARLSALWSARDMVVAQEVVLRLMEHPSPAVAATGVDVLALTGVDPATLTDDVWRRLLGAPSPEVQEAALALFGRNSDETLTRHAPLVVAFATAPSTGLRQAARPLVARVAARDPALATRLARELIDSLFLTPPDDAYATDIVALLDEALPDQLAALDTGTLWRLLQARAKGAQLLGATVLSKRPFDTFSVRQTARLGNHAHLAVRQWVMAAYEAAPDRFRAEAADAVLIVESDWPEVTEFARRYFDAWPPDAWTPETIAVVTDSVKPEVLDFARHLLRSRLAPADVGAQLTRLLEHPSQSMHLLVSELLTQDAVTSDAAFDRLMPLARIVMLQVHKGRVAKDRMSAFLHGEALRDAARAQRIAPLFADLTLSGTARDRSHAILALRDITERHPGIASPVHRRPVARKVA